MNANRRNSLIYGTLNRMRFYGIGMEEALNTTLQAADVQIAPWEYAKLCRDIGQAREGNWPKESQQLTMAV